MFNTLAAWFVVANLAAGAWIILDAVLPRIRRPRARREPIGRTGVEPQGSHTPGKRGFPWSQRSARS